MLDNLILSLHSYLDQHSRQLTDCRNFLSTFQDAEHSITPSLVSGPMCHLIVSAAVIDLIY